MAQKLASDLTTTDLLDLLRAKVNVTVSAPAPAPAPVLSPSTSLDSLAALDKLSEEELQALVSSDPELRKLLFGVSSDYISPDLLNLSRQNDSASQSLLLLRQQQLNDKLDLMQQQLSLKNSLESQLRSKQSDHVLLNSLLADYQVRLEQLTNDYRTKLQALQRQSQALSPQIQQDSRLSTILGGLTRQPAAGRLVRVFARQSQRLANDFYARGRQEPRSVFPEAGLAGGHFSGDHFAKLVQCPECPFGLCGSDADSAALCDSNCRRYNSPELFAHCPVAFGGPSSRGSSKNGKRNALSGKPGAQHLRQRPFGKHFEGRFVVAAVGKSRAHQSEHGGPGAHFPVAGA